MKNGFLGLVNHYKDKVPGIMSENSEITLKNWYNKIIIDVNKYYKGLKTDLEESFHHLNA